MRSIEFITEGKRPGKSLVDAIQKVMPVAQEIWFHGSRATGSHRRNSDTDILVVVPDDLVGDQYLAVVRILQKLSSYFDNYDIQPAKAGTNIHRIAQEEGRLLWADEQIVNELKINNASGIGAVPNNQQIGYQGLQVVMRPSMFLELALPLDVKSADERETIEYIKKNLDEKGVGAPWLTVVIPEAWESEDFSQMAHVSNHDGRHRMHSILEQEGNDPVEVHIIVPHMRRRHITDAMIDHLRSGVLNQQGQYVSGPVFGAAK